MRLGRNPKNEVFETDMGERLQLVAVSAVAPRAPGPGCLGCPERGASGYCAVLWMHTERAAKECRELCGRLNGERR